MDWFKEKYYYKGQNARFYTFQLTLNMLKTYSSPIIIETGCQRMKEDLGAGMSTSIFAEFVHRYGGVLHVVDNSQEHLDIAASCVTDIVEQHNAGYVWFYNSDSVEFLKGYGGECDLLYLDSYDYPIGQIWEAFGGKTDLDRAMAVVDNLSQEKLLEKFGDIIIPCQEHCLHEFMAIEEYIYRDTIVLVDDNDLAGGGKPGLLKPYLKDKGWICLLDGVQTLWVQE